MAVAVGFMVGASPNGSMNLALGQVLYCGNFELERMIESCVWVEIHSAMNESFQTFSIKDV